MTVVEFEKVYRDYSGGVRALQDVSINVEEGRVYGILGRNGAGKTTLLRMIPPLLHPTWGEVRVFGKDPWEHEEIRLHIGYAAEDDERPPHMRPRDYFWLGEKLYPTWDDGMMRRYLSRFGLDESRRFSSLSKGQKRQASLLFAVCHKPSLLVLDEPAGGLDPVVRREFLSIVLELVAEVNTTVVFSSHIVPDVERVATDIIILHEGRVLLQTRMDKLQETIRLLEFPTTAVSASRLRLDRDVLWANESGGKIQAIVSCGNESAEQWLSRNVPDAKKGNGLSIRSLGLEDLFIKITGGHGQ
jgi:ABC-2 type transport system ATP-binding protein